jgi:uncharacterized DUF497 family protein
MGCAGCEWDPAKDDYNQRKRGISFADACCVFMDPNRTEVEDHGDYDEERMVVTGRVGAIILVVVYTERNGKERVISARKAEPREEKHYYARQRR